MIAAPVWGAFSLERPRAKAWLVSGKNPIPSKEGNAMRMLAAALVVVAGILVAAGCGIRQERWLRAKQTCADSGTTVAEYNEFTGGFRCAPIPDTH